MTMLETMRQIACNKLMCLRKGRLVAFAGSQLVTARYRQEIG